MPPVRQNRSGRRQDRPRAGGRQLMQQRHRLRQSPPGAAAAPATTHQRLGSAQLGSAQLAPVRSPPGELSSVRRRGRERTGTRLSPAMGAYKWEAEISAQSPPKSTQERGRGERGREPAPPSPSRARLPAHDLENVNSAYRWQRGEARLGQRERSLGKG